MDHAVASPGIDECPATTNSVPFCLMPNDVEASQIASTLPSGTTEMIEDILPVTESQHICLQFPPQHVIIHFPGALDALRLETACQEIVHRHSILRTVFVERHGTLFQVILRQTDVPFEYYECDGDVTDSDNRLCAEDIARPLPPNVPPLRFLFASHEDQGWSLIVQISHAVYDGESWPKILRELEALYNNQSLPLPPPAPFSTWAYGFLSHARTPETLHFWKDLLRDSSMTYIGQPLASMGEGEEFFVSTSRSFPASQPPSKITMASLAKAAWALALADYCQTKDVVFGLVTHGRTHGLPGEDKIVGPCFNQIPIRVDLRQVERSKDLLTYVQDRQLATMEYDRVQLCDIIEQCTTWPRDTVFGTVFQHDNGTPMETVLLGNTRGSTRERYVPQIGQQLRDFWICSSVQDGIHTVFIYATNAFLSQKSAERLVDSMVAYMHGLVKDPSATLNDLSAGMQNASSWKDH